MNRVVLALSAAWLTGIAWLGASLEAQSPDHSWQYLAADSRVTPRAILRDCRRPSEIIGVMRAIGDIQFVVSSEGKPDTSSVLVVAASGASVSGFRSGARRYLGTCRFIPARVKGSPVSVLLLARIVFARDSMVLMTSRTPADTVLTETATPVAPDLERIYENAEAEVDEKPRFLPCGRNWGTFTVPEHDDAAAWVSGSVLLEFVIRPSGRPDPSTAHILSTDNALVAREVLTSYMGCRFVPGRVNGEPVPVRVRVGDRR